jgi:uncharacterized protein (DUF58 family)
MLEYLPFLILLMVIAALLKQDAVITIFYLLFGVYIIGVFWSKKALSNVNVTRVFSRRIFLNQPVNVDLLFQNRGWLPVIWLQLHESLPIELISPNFYHQVIHLGSHAETHLTYSFRGNKRGYYPIGPLFLTSGDILGLSKNDERKVDADHLIVYPKIIPFAYLGVPSHSPFGTLKHNSPVYEDPSRVWGKRDYQRGDSLRRVDWKSSAVSGHLMVKQFEASISLDIEILLNLNAEDYDIRTRFDYSELAVVAAASIASWANQHKQSMGFNTNGSDPLVEDAHPRSYPPRKGTLHLMNILDLLARIQVSKDDSFSQLIRRTTANLPWGTTLVLITSQMTEELFDELFQTQRSGLNGVVILVGRVSGWQEAQQRARHFGFPLYNVKDESDIEAWQ